MYAAIALKWIDANTAIKTRLPANRRHIVVVSWVYTFLSSPVSEKVKSFESSHLVTLICKTLSENLWPSTNLNRGAISIRTQLTLFFDGCLKQATPICFDFVTRFCIGLYNNVGSCWSPFNVHCSIHHYNSIQGARFFFSTTSKN